MERTNDITRAAFGFGLVLWLLITLLGSGSAGAQYDPCLDKAPPVCLPGFVPACVEGQGWVCISDGSGWPLSSSDEVEPPKVPCDTDRDCSDKNGGEY